MNACELSNECRKQSRGGRLHVRVERIDDGSRFQVDDTNWEFDDFTFRLIAFEVDHEEYLDIDFALTLILQLDLCVLDHLGESVFEGRIGLVLLLLFLIIRRCGWHAATTRSSTITEIAFSLFL